MAEKKVIELEVKTNTASLKSQLREAQQEVQELANKFGATSQEAVNAAKKAAELKDAIGDAKALTDAFNPDAKFNALSASIGGVLNGFQAFEGALGLVGVEGEAVQQTLLKVQSAMALSQGLQGLAEAKDSFKQLGAVIGQTALGQKLLTAAQIAGATAMRILNAVMAANPILLVVGAVGALVGALELLKRGQDDAANKQRELNRELEYTKRLEKETINATSQHVNELKKQHENKLRLKQAEGVADSKLAQIEIDNKKEILRYYNLVYQTAGKLNKDQLADAKQLREDLKVLEAQKITDLRESRASKKEIVKQDKEEELELRRDNLDSYKEFREKQLDLENQAYLTRKELQDKQREEDEARRLKEIEDAKALADAKFNLTRNTFTLIGDLATSFAGNSEKQQKRAFDIQKAANIAGGLMDTYKAALGAFRDTPGGPIIKGVAAGLTATAGLAMVNNIRKQEFRGGSTGNVPTPTGDVGGNNNQVITPNFNIIGNQNQTQLAQLNQAPIKAYVVGSDVTTQQMLDKKKIQNATL
jgi:hypothetical protein